MAWVDPWWMATANGLVEAVAGGIGRGADGMQHAVTVWYCRLWTLWEVRNYGCYRKDRVENEREREIRIRII